MLQYYEATHNGTANYYDTGKIIIPIYNWKISTSKESTVDPSSCKITSTIYYQDMTKTSIGGAFIKKGVKYSAYQLLRKALLTTDTYLLENGKVSLDEYHDNDPLTSINYPILLDPIWNNRLETAKINETIFEGKNLWEVLIQIGYYLHAIPYLEYATDGTDRFVLTFRQLGGTKDNKSASTKMTVFCSRNLSEYFTQFDSYVTNLFSPQNEVEEWIVPKTKASHCLVSNDTAMLQLTKPITELLAFDIIRTLPDGTQEIEPALEYVFEQFNRLVFFN